MGPTSRSHLERRRIDDARAAEERSKLGWMMQACCLDLGGFGVIYSLNPIRQSARAINASIDFLDRSIVWAPPDHPPNH